MALAVLGLLGPAGTTSASAAYGELTVSGQGFGHGRGLGQWGALGYAVDHGWTVTQIVDHYYRGTVPGQVGNPGIGVELLGLAGRDLIVTAPGLTVDNEPVPGGSVLLRRNPDGTFAKYHGTSCGGPWTLANGSLGGAPVVWSNESAADPKNHVQICEAGQTRGYRGNLKIVNTGSSSTVVNQVLLEDYLRGVVPRESSASWAGLGGGRGAQALQAQAIAARSYAIATPRSSYATTCDMTSCQVYNGEYTRSQNSMDRTSLEDSRTDAAVAATSGWVRKKPNGAVSRTEFSASTGGWTAGGEFPAVEDLGDAYAGNPNRSWSVTFAWADLERRLGVGTVTGLQVTGRNGLGSAGGRVTAVVVDTTTGPVTLSGNDVRIRLGLKSDWFSLSSTSSGGAESYARAIYQDLLGRTPGAAEVAMRADQLVRGYPRAALASDLARSGERVGYLVDMTYATALNRMPGGQERANWTAWTQAQSSLPALRAAIWGSPEAGLVRRSDADWVMALYTSVLGRPAGAGEVGYWTQAVRERGRTAVARGIAASEEARWGRLNQYYWTMLGRAADPGAAGWIPALAGDGDFTVVIGIAQSPEYMARAANR